MTREQFRYASISEIIESRFGHRQFSSARLAFDPHLARWDVFLYEADSLEQDVDTGRPAAVELLAYESRGPKHDEFAEDLIAALAAYAAHGFDPLYDEVNVATASPGVGFEVIWEIDLRR